MPISEMVAMKMGRRPNLSASEPNSAEPNGRTTMPTPNVAKTHQQRRGGIVRRKEQHAEISRQRGKGEEVVPFEEGAEAGGEDDFALGKGDFLHVRSCE